MQIYKKQSLAETFSVYFDRRMIKILLLGAISGFPWVIIGSSLSLWLKEDGLSRSTIGWAGLIFAVYAFNYLWAPIIDRVRIPWLTNKIGHRRGWIVLMQAIILICLVCWSLINPTTNLALVISIGLIIAIASATQDITVDALRIEQIGENEGKSMQAGAAMAVVGWWTGYKLGGVVALNAAEIFQKIGFENYWQITFLFIFLIIAMLLSISGLDFITSISGAASSISNVGPGLGEIIGPNGNYKSIPDLSKWILSAGMLLGRLELFAVLVLFFPSFWRN